MSHFTSDFLSWVTASAFGAAVVTQSAFWQGSDIQISTSQLREASEDAPILLASTNDDITEIREMIGTLNTPKAEPIKMAVLIPVEFNPSGMEIEQSPVGTSARAGIVTGSSVNLRSGPGTGNAVVGRAYKGEPLEITGQSAGVWQQVRLSSGEIAWIHGNFIDT